VDLDLDLLISGRLGLEDRGLGFGWWWTCYKTARTYTYIDV